MVLEWIGDLYGRVWSVVRKIDEEWFVILGCCFYEFYGIVGKVVDVEFFVLDDFVILF